MAEGAGGGEEGSCAMRRVLTIEEQTEDREDFSTCIWKPHTFLLRPLFRHLHVVSCINNGGRCCGDAVPISTSHPIATATHKVTGENEG